MIGMYKSCNLDSYISAFVVAISCGKLYEGRGTQKENCMYFDFFLLLSEVGQHILLVR